MNNMIAKVVSAYSGDPDTKGKRTLKIMSDNLPDIGTEIYYTPQSNIEKLESIIFDLCNGYHNWWDIHQDTGESDERCKEILEVYNQIKDKYK